MKRQQSKEGQFEFQVVISSVPDALWDLNEYLLTCRGTSFAPTLNKRPIFN